jgi:hypothetical protein
MHTYIQADPDGQLLNIIKTDSNELPTGYTKIDIIMMA